MVSTPSGGGSGVCVRSLLFSNAGCAGGCLGRRSVLGNKIVGYGVSDRPGLRENARPTSFPCSFSGRGGGWWLVQAGAVNPHMVSRQ